MTDKIKNAIETFNDYKENGYEPRSNNGELFDIAIRSLKAWEEVLHELEDKRDLIGRLSKSGAYDMAIYNMAIDIINQKLVEIEKGGAE